MVVLAQLDTLVSDCLFTFYEISRCFVWMVFKLFPYFTLIQTQYGSEVFDWLQYEIQYGLYDFV